MTPIERSSVRRALFESPQFIQRVAGATDLDPKIVDTVCEALFGAGLLPSASSGAADALADDGAMVLSALGSRQRDPGAIVRVSGRLRNMRHQVVVGSGGSAEAGEPQSRAKLFGGGLADVIKETWQATAVSTNGRRGELGVSILWGEGGEVLYGLIEHVTGRRHVYSSATLPVPHGIAAEWDFVELPTVGGQIFSPPSILRYATLLGEHVAGTAAELK